MAIIDKPSDYFNTLLYTGNGGTLNVTGVGFAPNWVWLKRRDSTGNHYEFDTVRGATQRLLPNLTAADAADSNTLSAFGSDGFTVKSEADINASSGTFVSWNWKETADAGFDIVAYTGNGSNRTISHSCGAIPKMIIIKDRDADDNWNVYTAPTGNDSHMHLNLTNAASGSSSYWNDTTPTSSVFSLGSNSAVNANGNNFIAYCFAEKQGYSKIGSYTGNGNANGTFVYTGFKPAMVIIKQSSGADNWVIYDNKRDGFNGDTHALFPNNSDGQTTDVDIDLVSNGFKIVRASGRVNASGETHIYMAFAENPFVTSTGNNSIPGTAR